MGLLLFTLFPASETIFKRSMSCLKALSLFLLLCTAHAYSQSVEQFNIHFKVGSYSLSGKAQEKLDSLAELLLKRKRASLTITGYADYRGKSQENLQLSNKRATAAQDYLAEKGVEQQRIRQLEGKGEAPHGIDSLNEQQLAQDRKVVIKIKWPAPPIKPQLRPVAKRPEPKMLRLDTLPVGAKIELKDVFFIPGRHYPYPASMIALEGLYETLNTNPSIRIEIQGHICCHKPPGDGMDIDTRKRELSVNRAKYVWLFLVEKGIDPDRMQYKGFASTQPKVWPEMGPADQNANRRVEIEILDR